MKRYQMKFQMGKRFEEFKAIEWGENNNGIMNLIGNLNLIAIMNLFMSLPLYNLFIYLSSKLSVSLSFDSSIFDV